VLKGLQDVAWSDDEVSPPFQAFALGIMAVVERRDVTREASVELGWMHVFTASDGPFRVNRVLKLRLINLSSSQDDPDCLLCAEPLDLSDLNFKPCQCGMQVSWPSCQSVWQC
jgi:hypothetical protein